MACNAVFGIEEGTPAPATSGAGAAGGAGGQGGASSSSGGGGAGAGGDATGGGSPVCGPSACAEVDYEPGGACAAVTIYASAGDEDQDLEGTGILSDLPRERFLWGKGDGSTIVATPFGGGASTVLVDAPAAPDAHYPYQMARDEQNLYWVTFYDGTLSRLALENGLGAVRVATAPGIGLDKSITLFNGQVFYATMVSSDPSDSFCNQAPNTCTDKLFAAPVGASGADATLVYEDPAERFRIGGVTSDGTSVFFTTCYEFVDDGKVYRLDDPAGAPLEIASFSAPTSSCGEIVADPGPGGRLYWMAADTLLTSLKEPSETVVKGNAPSASRLVADDEYLYWISQGSEIMRAPKKTVGPAVRVGVGVNAFGLAVDCGHITWTNTHDMNQPGSTITLLSATR